MIRISTGNGQKVYSEEDLYAKCVSEMANKVGGKNGPTSNMMLFYCRATKLCLEEVKLLRKQLRQAEATTKILQELRDGKI